MASETLDVGLSTLMMMHACARRQTNPLMTKGDNQVNKVPDLPDALWCLVDDEVGIVKTFFAADDFFSVGDAKKRLKKVSVKKSSQ